LAFFATFFDARAFRAGAAPSVAAAARFAGAFFRAALRGAASVASSPALAAARFAGAFRAEAGRRVGLAPFAPSPFAASAPSPSAASAAAAPRGGNAKS
jgi:hypothetical protein